MIPMKIPATIPGLIPVILPNDDYYVPANLQLWYKMLEGAGSVLGDASGQGHTGAIAAGVTWVPGGGLSFDGVTGHKVEVSFVTTSHDLSFEFWLRPANFTLGQVWFDAQVGHLEFFTDVGSAHFKSLTNTYAYTFSAGVWVHVIVTVVGGVQEVLWVNGASEVGANAPGNVGIDGSQVELGGVYAAGLGAFNGQMGAFRAYDRALSGSEVGVLFAQDRARYGI